MRRRGGRSGGAFDEGPDASDAGARPLAWRGASRRCGRLPGACVVRGRPADRRRFGACDRSRHRVCGRGQQLAREPVHIAGQPAAARRVAAAVRVASSSSPPGPARYVVLDGFGPIAALRSGFRRLGGLLSIALWRYALMALYSLPPLALALLAYVAVFGVRDPVAAWARGSQALITIGAALAIVLLVLWAYLSLRWAFATAAFVEHGYRGRAALRRSRELTSGHWVRLGAGIVALSVAAVLVGGVVQGLARNAAIGLGPDASFTVLALLIGLNFLLGLVTLLAVFVALNSLVLAAYCGAYPQLPTPLAARGTLGRAWTVVALVAIAAARGGGGRAVDGPARGAPRRSCAGRAHRAPCRRSARPRELACRSPSGPARPSRPARVRRAAHRRRPHRRHPRRRSRSPERPRRLDRRVDPAAGAVGRTSARASAYPPSRSSSMPRATRRWPSRSRRIPRTSKRRARSSHCCSGEAPSPRPS